MSKPIRVRDEDYERLKERKLVRTEPFPSVINRVLDDLEDLEDAHSEDTRQ